MVIQDKGQLQRILTTHTGCCLLGEAAPELIEACQWDIQPWLASIHGYVHSTLTSYRNHPSTNTTAPITTTTTTAGTPPPHRCRSPHRIGNYPRPGRTPNQTPCSTNAPLQRPQTTEIAQLTRRFPKHTIYAALTPVSSEKQIPRLNTLSPSLRGCKSLITIHTATHGGSGTTSVVQRLCTIPDNPVMCRN